MPQAPLQRRSRPALSVVPTRRASPTWEAAVLSFLTDARRRNLAPATVDTYESILTNQRTTQWREDHGVKHPSDFTAATLRAFEGELLEVGLSPRSIIAYHRVLKTFAGYCLREGIAIEERVLTVEGPKQELKEPEVFTPAEEARLIAAARTERDRLLVEFMLRTGLRLREVAQLTVDDIITTPTGSYVRVRQGKGKKDRAVPLDTARLKLTAKIHRYLKKVRPRDTEQRGLFLSEKRVDGDYKPLSERGIQILLYRLGQDTGIHVHPHKFRHTFATRALSAGVDVMALQRALGHTTLTMVSRYVHFQKDDLIEAWKRRRD
jgi:site-specific recombinase XerD